MLSSTLDLIIQVTPQSHQFFAFFFFNLIIAIILMGSKNDPNHEDDQEIHLGNSANHIDKRLYTEVDTEQSANTINGVLCVYQTVSEESQGSEEEEEEEEDSNDENYQVGLENDDELAKRAQEFIAKVNSEWKAEMLNDDEPPMCIYD
ncbi:hypothetical protein CCACVL1_02305 [Corchorus capsularis]|uniref:Uncharacterized protein n=1 Tax=Corchorus capsularis TaxID=210143 RepID=A0A1R3K9C3_COCAP|nr:hypothetical protein CCACVL1_02305 [Corchorus capsularis]